MISGLGRFDSILIDYTSEMPGHNTANTNNKLKIFAETRDQTGDLQPDALSTELSRLDDDEMFQYGTMEIDVFLHLSEV